MEPTKLALEKAYNYPLFQALAHRRSRRFRLGCEIEDGSFQYKSDKEPVPLSKTETALLCFAAAGQTGLIVAGDNPFRLGGDCQPTWDGRTFPSVCNTQKTALLFTNDEGVYLYKPRKSKRAVEIETLDDLANRLQDFDKDVIKIKDGRLEIPHSPPALFRSNIHDVNYPGQTMFLPVVDVSYEEINAFLAAIRFEGYYYTDPDTGKPAGMEKWIDKLKLSMNVPLQLLEQKLLVSCSLSAAFMIQNLLLMAEAMGLGGMPFGGFNPLIIMGGTPICRGLGFHWITTKKGALNPIGIDGVFESYCPPYWENISSAVDALVNEKYGPGGTYTPETDRTPLLDQELAAKRAEKVPEEVIQCTKDLCTYIYENYGRFPGTVDTMSIPISACIHHLDLDYYKENYVPGLINETHERHMADWHGK